MRNPQQWRAITLFLYVMFGNALTVVIVNHLTAEAAAPLHPFQLVFMTSLIAALGFAPQVRAAWSPLRKGETKWLHLLRATLEFASFSSAFYAVSQLPVPLHTALMYTGPVFGVLLAIWLLKEHASMMTFLCVAMGFAGVLILSRPDQMAHGMQPAMLFSLAAALGFALCSCIIKLLTRSTPPQHIAIAMLYLTSLIALPFALSVWRMPNLAELPWLLLLGLLAYSLQRAVALALSNIAYVAVAPLSFAQLLFAAAMSYVAFDYEIQQSTLLGALVIVAATSLNGWYAARHARQLASREDRRLAT